MPGRRNAQSLDNLHELPPDAVECLVRERTSIATGTTPTAATQCEKTSAQVTGI